MLDKKNAEGERKPQKEYAYTEERIRDDPIQGLVNNEKETTGSMVG
jgi:hypothetical protein